jgi:Effector-associated domain 1
MPLIRLTPLQTRRTRDAILAAFPSSGQLDDLLLDLGKAYAELEIQGQNYRENILSIIRRAEAEDWVLKLVLEARKRVPADPEFEALERDLKPSAPPPNVDHFNICRLTGSYVMVDRSRLRSALREISRPLGKRILVVKGDPKTGKSHTLQLISYLQYVYGNFSLVPVDLEAFVRTLGPAVIVNPSDLATYLVDQLTWDWKVPDPPNDSQWARWVLEFCVKFEGRARQDQQVRWVVIDALNTTQLMQPTLDLIKELAHRINLSLPNYRLILLGFSDSLPATVLPNVEEEKIAPIGQQELIEFFARAYQELNLPLDADKVADVVKSVLERIDPAQSDFVARLGAIASQEVEAIASGRR